MVSEFEIIKNLRILFPRIGDDAEVFNISPGFSPLVSIDSFVHGIHFDISLISPSDAGYRSCAAALSDIAAMGGRPKVILCSIGLPEGDIALVESLARGIKALANEFNTEIIGGDTVMSDTLFLSLCVIGESKKIVRRNGARIGDILCVTGPLGGSTAGLKILREGLKHSTEVVNRYSHPKPRIEQGLILSEHATSMIDISDGLAIDLYHLLEESKVGAVVHTIPIENKVRDIAILVGENPNDFALYGGEDFELLFTINRDNLNKLNKKMDFFLIGEIVEEGMKFGNGSDIKLGGYDHFTRIINH